MIGIRDLISYRVYIESRNRYESDHSGFVIPSMLL